MKRNRVPPGAGQPGVDQLSHLFMLAFLAALAMLFLSTLALYFVFMARSAVWPPAGTPLMPPAFWLGLPLLILGSIAMHAALGKAAQQLPAACAGLVLATFLLALAFAALQVAGLRGLLAAGLNLKSQFGALVAVMSVLHAAHVAGGLVALALTYFRARRGVFRPGALASLRSAAMYWHFLDAVWLGMLALLWATGWR